MCDCEPEVDEPSEEATHFKRTCKSCGANWWGLHCPHDGYQNPCPECKALPMVEADGDGWPARKAMWPGDIFGLPRP